MVGTSKIAVIGDKDIVLAFGCIGADVFPYTNPHKVRETLKDIIKHDYTLIMITESEAAEVQDIVDSLENTAYPIIMPIPNGVERQKYGARRLLEYIGKATGNTRGEDGK
jgi:vacuolar-type H+-ATPase subunit F/Vma7